MPRGVGAADFGASKPNKCGAESRVVVKRSRMRVLVVDDDEMSQELVRGILTRSGHTVDTAADGREALEILRRGTHRMVISDWEMPHLSGPDLCAAIRAED